MRKDQHDAIPGFSLVAPTIWEYTPKQQSLRVEQYPPPPNVVICCFWPNAQTRHILKYTEIYQSLFPTANILALTSSTKDLCFRSSSQKQKSLRPAVDRIISYYNVNRILIHAFSESGSSNAVELVETYYKTTGTRLPCSALILDSTPGLPRFRRLRNALEKSLPRHRVLHYSGLCTGALVLGIAWVLYGVFGGHKDDVVSRTRRRLVDEKAWDLNAPRCYLYSEADELVAWQDVHDHAADTGERGVPVMDVRFPRSEHCRHAVEDVVSYWDAVILAWRRVMLNESSSGARRSRSETDSERTLWT